MAAQTESEPTDKLNVDPADMVPEHTPTLEVTESKQEIATRLTSLISTFRDEAEQQDEILSALNQEALSNPDFGKLSHVTQWTIYEVCYWLSTIDLQDYVHAFYTSAINGTILLNDITEESLKNDLNVKPQHCTKIMNEIQSLKKHSSATNGNNVNDIIATIKHENEELLFELERQQSLKSDLSLNKNIAELHSIPNGVNMEEIINDKSLRDIVESQNKIIEDLTNQLQQLQTVSNKRIKELQKKNKKLQDGYIQIETHYQKQLQQSRMQSKNLRAQLSNINHEDDSGQIGLLWAENENTTKDLEHEREKRVLLEASLKQMELKLNREKQKRKLLESQTSRLTAELTKYLTSNSKETTPNAQPQRFARFKLNKNKNKNKSLDSDTSNEAKVAETEPATANNTGDTLTVNDNTHKSRLRRKPSMDAKAGWLKFLSTAGQMGNKLNNIQQKWARGRSDDSVEEQKEIDVVQEEIEAESDLSATSPQRRATLGETVLKKFKKIQTAAHQKMEERAKKKNINYDDEQFVDIADIVSEKRKDDDNNVSNGMDKDDDEEKVDYVADEDSSAEEAETHHIVVTEPVKNEKKRESFREREELIGMEFTPDMMQLAEVAEPDASV